MLRSIAVAPPFLPCQGFPIMREGEKKKRFPCSIQKPNTRENPRCGIPVHHAGASRNRLGSQSRHLTIPHLETRIAPGHIWRAARNPACARDSYDPRIGGLLRGPETPASVLTPRFAATPGGATGNTQRRRGWRRTRIGGSGGPGHLEPLTKPAVDPTPASGDAWRYTPPLLVRRFC